MKRKEYNSGSLPEACSCGSAASDTSGREGRKKDRTTERKTELSVDCGAQTEEPFIQHVQGGNAVPLFFPTVLLKTYKHGMQGHCGSTVKPVAEIVTEDV